MRNLDIVNMKNSIKGRKSKILKLFLCFLLLGVSYSFANNNNYSQLKTLSVNVNNKTLREVFQTIEKTSQFVFFYLDDAINLDRKVSIDSKDKKIDEILTELFEGTSCTYRISDRQVFISGKSAAVSAAQQQNARKNHRSCNGHQRRATYWCECYCGWRYQWFNNQYGWVI